jgi:hypothetical protein
LNLITEINILTQVAIYGFVSGKLVFAEQPLSACLPAKAGWNLCSKNYSALN